MSASPFANLPHVPVPQELLDRAFGRAARVTYEDPNAVWKARRLTAAKLQSATENLNHPLVKVVKGFPTLERLHPFYRDIIDLTVGIDDMRKALGTLDWARKEVLALGQEASTQALRLRFPAQAESLLKHVYGRISSVVRQITPHLELLRTARTKLRALPAIDTGLPIAAVCGAPNVGKSSIVRALSTGKPEVAGYPFTTKEVSLGHIPHRYVNLQVMDTPGLLDRPAEERNEVEQQAALALTHLDPLIIYILDPSPHCGYPMEEQLHLRKALREEFPDQPWVDVWTKCDLLDEPETQALKKPEKELESYQVSATEGTGMEKLKTSIVALMDVKLRELAEQALDDSIEAM